jgi:hypothetical protein
MTWQQAHDAVDGVMVHPSCRTLASGARRHGEPLIDFRVFYFIVNKGVAT